MRIQFASITMDIAYNKEKSIVIRRFPTEYETKELKKFKYKLVDEETFTSDNQIELKMHYNTKKTSVDHRTETGRTFRWGGTYGVEIDLHMTHAEEELNEYLRGVIRHLCEKYLKPCILLSSRHSINCEIDECELTTKAVKQFFEDFVTTVEGEMSDFKVTKKEKKMEEKAEEKVKQIKEEQEISKISEEKQIEEVLAVCSQCGKEIKSSEDIHTEKTVFRECFDLCSDCYNKKNAIDNKPDEKIKKMETKWKVILLILTIIACATLGLLAKSFLGI